MQSVKFVMREVGVPGGNRISAADFEEYIQYQFLSDGYKIQAQHADPLYEDKDFKGYRVFLTLVKESPALLREAESVKAKAK